MNENHITEILDQASFAKLSQSERDEVRTHAQSCVSCKRALEAAQLSELVLTERALITVEPSPFFQTRVLAALRERQAAEGVPAVWRLWKSAKALVSAMAVTTAALAALSFLMPAPSNSGLDQSATAYSAEELILDQGNADQMTYEQVLSTIYADEDEAR